MAGKKINDPVPFPKLLTSVISIRRRCRIFYFFHSQRELPGKHENQTRSHTAAIVGEVNCIEGQHVEAGQILFTLKDVRKPDHSIGSELLKITAPLSGSVVYLNVRPGEVTDPESPTPLVELVDLSRLIVAADIPSSQISILKLGQKVEIIPQQISPQDMFSQIEPNKSNATRLVLTGKVALIEDRVDRKTDMVPVDVSVPAAR